MEETRFHLVIVPGFVLDRWLHAVEVKLMRDPNLENEVVRSSDHCVLLGVSGDDTDPIYAKEFHSTIFQVDDEYFEFYIKNILNMIQDELRMRALYRRNEE